jgi:hypothetical protein
MANIRLQNLKKCGSGTLKKCGSPLPTKSVVQVPSKIVVPPPTKSVGQIELVNRVRVIELLVNRISYHDTFINRSITHSVHGVCVNCLILDWDGQEMDRKTFLKSKSTAHAHIEENRTSSEIKGHAPPDEEKNFSCTKPVSGVPVSCQIQVLPIWALPWAGPKHGKEIGKGKSLCDDWPSLQRAQGDINS